MILGGFSIYRHGSDMSMYVSPHPILELIPPPSPPHPSGLSALLQVSNLHWSSISHTVIYMFQCYSLRSSHPHLLTQSPKDCSLHLCLFCCLTCGVIVTIFEVSPKEGTCCLRPFPTGSPDVWGHGTSQRCSGGMLVKTHLGEVSSAVSICLFL